MPHSKSGQNITYNNKTRRNDSIVSVGSIVNFFVSFSLTGASYYYYYYHTLIILNTATPIILRDVS